MRERTVALRGSGLVLVSVVRERETGAVGEGKVKRKRW
jgi:hypothetical protein